MGQQCYIYKLTIMNTPYYKTLPVLVFVLCWLIFAEYSLDVLRHIKNSLAQNTVTTSETTPRQPKKNQNAISPNSNAFPFNSRPVTVKEYSSTKYRLWMSSSSHGADEHGIANQFPNLLCNNMGDDDCYLLNQSRAGTVISHNTELLITQGPVWSPRYTLLYQMTLDIVNISKKVFANSGTSSAPKLTYTGRSTLSTQIIDYFGIREVFENLSLYMYPREFIGSNFLLQTQLKNSLPKTSEEIFKQTINHYIDASLSIGATPVLVTFLSAHSPQDKDPIPWRMQTWSMIWDEKLSPRCLVNTVGHYNDALRSIAQKRNIPLIDLERIWGPDNRKQYFDDFVHFNTAGHKRVANIIATQLKQVILNDI